MHPSTTSSAGAPPAFARRPGIFDLFAGLALPLRGARLLARAPALRRWAFFAAGVALLSVAGVVAALVYGVAPAFAHLWPEPSAVGGRVLWELARWAVLIAGFALGVLTVPTLALVPLEDPISEATEDALGLAPPKRAPGQYARSLAVGLAHTAFRLGVLWVGQLLLLLLLLAAPLAPLWPPASTLWTALWLAAEYCAIPITRRLQPVSEVRRLLWTRRWLCLGFGLSLWVMFWVPVLNLVFVPLAIVSGTLLHAGVRAADLAEHP